MLKRCIFHCWLIVSVSILNLALFCSTLLVALLVVDIRLRLNLSCFGLLKTWSRSASCWLHSTVSMFFALFCLTPRAFLVVDVVSTVSTFLSTSTRSSHCSDVSDSFLNTLTFVELVLVSSSPLCRSNLLPLMFHSPELLQCFKSVSVLLLFVLLFNIAFLSV